MKKRLTGKFILLLLLICLATAGAAAQSAEAEVKRAAQTAFDRLRSGDYAALYDELPAASRQRIGRERFVEALRRAQGMYQLNRLETGGVAVEGDAAVLDTIVYGSVREPVQGEGRIEVRQFFEREGGRWRVVTDDRTAVRRLLAAHPKLARRFPARPPRVFVRRDNQWVELTPNRPRR